mmetsp:Transcript_5879/g.18544  ORF Transcript_5879/g.18544 Transcript_5879/m.18544 type:complete len:204 (-) Transcript_5879:347-958(-)
MELRESWMKSVDTSSSAVTPSTPCMYDCDAFLSSASISLIDVSRSVVKVRSTTETSGVGTRKAMPVSLPLVTGSTSPTALAAPVVDGMMLHAAARPPRQSFIDGPSTVFCVAVYAWIVVMRPVWMPRPSLSSTCTTGARQLVVHDAFETTWCWLVLYSWWLTPMTRVLAPPLAGAEMMTFLAPALRWPSALLFSTKRPVDSMT